MIAELLLVLSGHPSSLFTPTGQLDPAFAELLHPGEQTTLEYLARIATRYRGLKEAVNTLGASSEYISSMCSAIRGVLKEYEALVVQTERRILQRDDELVAGSSFVPLAAMKAVFSEWDAPMAALHALVEFIRTSEPAQIAPGRLIDLLMERSGSGVARIAEIMSDLSLAVQRVWRMHLIAYLIHGSLAPHDPFATLKPHRLNTNVMPLCVSPETRDSIAYVGRAIMTVQAASGSSSRHHQQLPRSIALAHAKMLAKVLPGDGHEFDVVMAEIRSNISEWLWTTVLTRRDVDDAIEFFANFFLMRNGEFAVALIREIERLKLSRLTPRPSSRTPGISVIREQDLALALLRASLGTSAQHDPSLSKLKFVLPTGPLRPLLPSLDANPDVSVVSVRSIAAESNFTTNLLGTALELTYALSWPLDLFLTSADLQLYTHLFAYFSAIRHTHHRVMNCWTNLSNSQRARRRWARIGDGGEQSEGAVRRDLLRCGWGVVREMMWFLDALWGYICIDVVEEQYHALKTSLRSSAGGKGKGRRRSGSASSVKSDPHAPPDTDGEEEEPDALSTDGRRSRVDTVRPRRTSFGAASATAAGVTRPRWSTVGPHVDGGGGRSGTHTSSTLDFATLRTLHSAYLYALNTGSLLGNVECAGTIKAVMELCDVFVAAVERWGGDILPGLLGEGSLGDSDTRILRERSKVVQDVNETLDSLLETFYEQLIASLSSHVPLGGNGDTTATTTSAFFTSPFHAGNTSTTGKAKISSMNRATDAEVRRTLERLLLRLDFNNGFSKAGRVEKTNMGILQEGGLA